MMLTHQEVDKLSTDVPVALPKADTPQYPARTGSGQSEDAAHSQQGVAGEGMGQGFGYGPAGIIGGRLASRRTPGVRGRKERHSAQPDLRPVADSHQLAHV